MKSFFLKIIKLEKPVFIKLLKRIIIGWGLLIPLSYLIPKNNSIIFITRFSNNFDGNLKYLFLFFLERKKEFPYVYFLTTDRGVEEELKSGKFPVLFFPGIKAIYKMLRAGTVILDGNEWIWQYKYHMLFNARKIQLWHGSGMKTIALMKSKYNRISRYKKFKLLVKGKHPLYDLLILNSTIQKNTRAQAFRFKEIMINGQPRNDIFFKNDIKSYLTGIDADVYSQCVKYKNDGYKLAVYCPTHRERTALFSSLKDILDVARLNRFAVDNKIIFIFKYHPKTLDLHTYDLSDAANILEYKKNCDVYPLLTICDLMITDYSSIFVDYILQDRPVIFFPFDYEQYTGGERPLQFDYKEVTPGAKCFTYNELEAEIKKTIVDGDDVYSEKRKEVLKKFFDIVDGRSCERIMGYLMSGNK